MAAKKAFVTNRVGDFGFMIAMFLMFEHFESFNYSVVLAPLDVGARHPRRGHRHRPRPDALPRGGRQVGPAPAVHVAARRHGGPDPGLGPDPRRHHGHRRRLPGGPQRPDPALQPGVAQWIIAIIGAVTALFAATIACAQNDIKRVLAYSTLSQLGYMFLADGCGGYSAGMFHMITHAFFKALLFLAAGSVIHAMHDEQNMKTMGGLRKYLPITFPTFIVGYLALSGIPPFAGFWSKDDILAAAWHKSPALWAVGAVDGRPHRLLHEPPGGRWSSAGQARWEDRGRRPTGRGRSTAAGEPRRGDPHEAPAGHDDDPAVILAVALDLRRPAQLPGRRPRLPRQVAGAGVPRHHRPDRPRGHRPKWILGVIVTVSPSAACSPVSACGGGRSSTRPSSRPSCSTAGTSTRPWPPASPVRSPRLSNLFSFSVDPKAGRRRGQRRRLG